MSSRDQLKRAVCETIDRHADAIIDLGETILRHPETGFNEMRTAALVAERMNACRRIPASR
jgi:metal-dependent amidase/aminoacylase/carboxypeptidase family protein